MNKKIKIFVLFILIAIVCIIGSLFIINTVQIKEYKDRTILSKDIQYNINSTDPIENNEFNIGNLSIKLTGYNYYPEGNETYNKEKLLSTTVSFTINDSTNLDLITFDYIIYDEENNILNSSLWSNYQNNKNYVKGFIKEKYNSINVREFNKHIIHSSMSSNTNISENLKEYSISLIAGLNEEYKYPDKVTVTLLNIKYDTYNDNENKTEHKEIENTDFNFILNLSK